MRPPRFFQRSIRRLLPVSLLVLVLVTSLTSLGHASTYVGYGSSNQGSSTCGTNCEGNNVVTDGQGEIIQAPFAGSLVSAGFFTGSSVPNQIVILTDGSTVASTTYSCGSAGTCAFANSGQTFTIKDVETLSGLSGSAFFTVNLAAPVTVTQSQFVAIVFMRTTGAGSILMLVGSGGQTTTLDTCFGFGTTTPTVGNTVTTGSNACLGSVAIIGGTFTPAGTTGTTITQTQCYGNCGSPAVTLVNTNSTHSINFNQSLMVMYEFQSNINGFILNVTTNLGKSYSSVGGIGVGIGIYEVITCPIGQLPFTNACPGQLVLGKSSVIAAKGQYSAVASNGQIAVSNGQWVAVAITASSSGLDLNDTNTNVALFQSASPGGNVLSPTIRQSASASSLCGGCKMGLWAWIIGNIVSGGGPTTPALGCQSFATIDCWIPALVNSFCSTTSQQCQTSSALFWILILGIIFELTIAFSFNRIAPNLRVPFGEMFIFIILMLTFLMTGLSLLFLWIPVFLFMVGAIIFSKHTGRYF